MKVGDVVWSKPLTGLVVGMDPAGCHCSIAYEDGTLVADSVSFVEAHSYVVGLSELGTSIVNAAIAAEALRRMK